MDLVLAINSRVEDAELLGLDEGVWGEIPIDPSIISGMNDVRLSVLLSSPGGQCVAGENIKNLIEAAKESGSVEAYAVRAESAASHIFLDATERYFLSGGRFMMHTVSYDTIPALNVHTPSAVDMAYHKYISSKTEQAKIDELNNYADELCSKADPHASKPLGRKLKRQIEFTGGATELRLSGLELLAWGVAHKAPDSMEELWQLFHRNTGIDQETAQRSETLRTYWGDALNPRPLNSTRATFQDLFRASLQWFH